MPIRILIAIMLIAHGASAAAPAPAVPSPPPGMSVCECVRNKVCWKLAKDAFAIIVSGKKAEVEAAMPGRFFSGARTAALGRPDKDGHFLRVTCGADKVPCPSVRDMLEQRLANSSLVQSVSRQSPDALFSPATWALTDAGSEVQQEAKRCRPGLWSELAPSLVVVSVWD